MVSDAKGEQYKPMPTGIYLYVEDCDATYNRALQEGATSLMEPANQFYGDRSCGVKDQFGNQWWIATRKEDLSPEEYTKRKEDFMMKQQEKQEQNQH